MALSPAHCKRGLVESEWRPALSATAHEVLSGGGRELDDQGVRRRRRRHPGRRDGSGQDAAGAHLPRVPQKGAQPRQAHACLSARLPA
eukprot:2647128-Pleurochrysis_carterae.AAC.1